MVLGFRSASISKKQGKSSVLDVHSSVGDGPEGLIRQFELRIRDYCTRDSYPLTINKPENSVWSSASGLIGFVVWWISFDHFTLRVEVQKGIQIDI
ncbi:hypothetical protein QQP08_026642 [Theobroma cacao]|nr:hypothetical protein QQP08_026642 [Theobroma cacao]